MEHKKRNSNIELLRVIAMGMIVAGHFIGQSGFAVSGVSLNDYAISPLGSGAHSGQCLFAHRGLVHG